MRSCTLQCKRGRTDNRIGLRDCLSEMKLLSGRLRQKNYDRVRQKMYCQAAKIKGEVQMMERVVSDTGCERAFERALERANW